MQQYNQRQPMSPRQPQRLTARSQVRPDKIGAILSTQEAARFDEEETGQDNEYMKARRRVLGRVVTR
jgi:hypothetical protein